MHLEPGRIHDPSGATIGGPPGSGSKRCSATGGEALIALALLLVRRFRA